MAGRKATREESWESMHYSEASTDASDAAYDADEDMDDGEEPQLLTAGDVRRVLHPLQAAADRVGKQVERFAESLDRLSPRNLRQKEVDCNGVLPVIREYESIAAETVKRLRRRHEPERQEKLKRSLKKRIKQASGRSTPSDQYIDSDAEDPSSTTVTDLQHWEHERQTWQLLGIMVQIQFPSSSPPPIAQEDQYCRPQNTPTLHRYSTEHQVWNNFLEHEPAMWEKHVVVEWLKSNANSMGQDIDTVVEELESGADRGSGLWAHGWLYSKEAIKNQKRLRSWPQALDPNAPGIAESLVEPEKSEPLVTQLDPDAYSRQERALMKEDVFFERATWLACWEMTRRGYSWQRIRDWCQKRVEVWRAISMQGDPRLGYGDSDSNASMQHGWRSRALWRKMCAKAAEDGGIDEYERAVYGALSGHLQSVEAVSRTWDDLLFAHYNSQLLQSFDLFVQGHFPERTKDFDSFKRSGPYAVPASMDGAQAWDLLLRQKSTKSEALTPIKVLQGSIIAKKTREFLADQAYALSAALGRSDKNGRKLVLPLAQRAKQLGPTANVRLEDYDALRILTHVALVLQDLGHLREFEPAVEQIIIAYVDFLGKAGKQQLLPLYASRLSPEGAAQCMARQLPSIVETGERQTVLRLMQQYEMDVPGILLMQLVLVTQDRPVDPKAKRGYPPLRILESVAPGHNALPQIRQGFMGQGFDGDDYDLINGVEWYLLLGRHWRETMYAGSLVYKYLLLTGAFAAARELSRRVAFSTISLTKTRDILGHPLDLANLSDEDDDTTADGPVSRATKQRRRRSADQLRTSRAQREELLEWAHTFLDLERLVVLLDALEAWSALAARSSEVHTRSGAAWKSAFQAAHAAVVEAAEPVLAQRWLAHPATDAEAAEFDSLRAAYLPEIVLAYNTVLVIGGQMISRDNLVRSMDLAALVADPASGLAPAFVAASRMSELVQAFAVSSRFMLKADEAGNRKGRGLRRRKSGEALGIWSVPASATGR